MTQSRERQARRRILRLAYAGAMLLPTGTLLLRPARAAEPRLLDEADPAAKALGYKTDTTQVDAAKFPQHKPTQICGGCRYYQGKPSSELGPCTLFAGKGDVHSKGWCAAFAAK
jgi:hypothetical protein